MGAAILIGLAILVLVALGFMIHGAMLGLATLGHLVRRLWVRTVGLKEAAAG